MKKQANKANDNTAVQLTAVLNAAAEIVDKTPWKATAYGSIGSMYHSFAREMPHWITKCIAQKILGGGNIKEDLFNLLTDTPGSDNEIHELTGELLSFNVASAAAMLNDHLRACGKKPFPELDAFINRCLDIKSEKENDNAV